MQGVCWLDERLIQSVFFFVIWCFKICTTSLLLNAILWKFHISFYTFWKLYCHAKTYSMWYIRGSRNLYKRRTLFRTMVTVSLEMRSVCNWMPLFISQIVCKFSETTLSFKYPPTENNRKIKPGEVDGHENSSSSSRGYRFDKCMMFKPGWIYEIVTRIPPGNGQTYHSAWGKYQKWLEHRWTRDRILRCSVKCNIPQLDLNVVAWKRIILDSLRIKTGHLAR
jgi:hypothetical protein